MLAVLLIEEDSIAEAAIKSLTDEEICTIRVRDPLRLLDAMQELGPDILVIRRRDFPLHAQMIMSFARFCQPLLRTNVLIIGSSSESEKQTTAISEAQFREDPSIIARFALGITRTPSHRGSRLVAKAQRIMKE